MKRDRMLNAIFVGIIAFFELCLTGKAINAWKMARKEKTSNHFAECGAHPAGMLCD